MLYPLRIEPNIISDDIFGEYNNKKIFRSYYTHENAIILNRKLKEKTMGYIMKSYKSELLGKTGKLNFELYLVNIPPNVTIDLVYQYGAMWYVIFADKNAKVVTGNRIIRPVSEDFYWIPKEHICTISGNALLSVFKPKKEKSTYDSSFRNIRGISIEKLGIKKTALMLLKGLTIEKIGGKGVVKEKLAGHGAEILFFTQGYGKITFENGYEYFERGDAYLIPAEIGTYSVELAGEYMKICSYSVKNKIIKKLKYVGYSDEEIKESIMGLISDD